MSNSLVAVYCTAYNHGKYIRKTLEGFVNQKTNFDFRVFVHDDASTDDTAEIMREFEKQYPDKFVMIYENENQYSKGISIRDIVFPMMNEKYTAFCEGDDYWCDPNKLQLQVDYMESHPKCTLCVHDTMRINVEGNPIRRVNGRPVDIDYDANDVIAADGIGLFQTSSYLAKSDVLKSRPKEISIYGIGDYPNAIYLAMQGYVHYVGRVMSCYRTGVPGSWTVRTVNTIEKSLDWQHHVLEEMIKMDEFTEHKYSKGFNIKNGCALAFFYKHGYRDYKLSKLIFRPKDMYLVCCGVIYILNRKTLVKIRNRILSFFSKNNE